MEARYFGSCNDLFVGCIGNTVRDVITQRRIEQENVL